VSQQSFSLQVDLKIKHNCRRKTRT